MNTTQRLKLITERTGCVRYEIVRQHRHLIVDFVTDRGNKARVVMAKSLSDGAHGLQNQIAEVRRQLNKRGF